MSNRRLLFHLVMTVPSTFPGGGWWNLFFVATLFTRYLFLESALI